MVLASMDEDASALYDMVAPDITWNAVKHGMCIESFDIKLDGETLSHLDRDRTLLEIFKDTDLDQAVFKTVAIKLCEGMAWNECVETYYHLPLTGWSLQSSEGETRLSKIGFPLKPETLIKKDKFLGRLSTEEIPAEIAIDIRNEIRTVDSHQSDAK